MSQVNPFSTNQTDLSSANSTELVPLLFSNRKLTEVTPKSDAVIFLNNHCPALLKKIWEVAKLVFFTSIGLFLYWTNPTLFAMGFITGIIYDENVRNAIKKIKMIWVTQTWKSCLIGGVASFLSLPVTLATSSFIWGAQLGYRMSQEGQKILRSNQLVPSKNSI